MDTSILSLFLSRLILNGISLFICFNCFFYHFLPHFFGNFLRSIVIGNRGKEHPMRIKNDGFPGWLQSISKGGEKTWHPTRTNWNSSVRLFWEIREGGRLRLNRLAKFGPLMRKETLIRIILSLILPKLRRCPLTPLELDYQ